MRRLSEALIPLVAAGLVALAGSACTPGADRWADADGVRVGIRTDPHPAGLGDNRVFVYLREHDAPATGRTVHFRLFMPGMPMNSDNTWIAAENTGKGLYEGIGDFSMGGEWQMEIRLDGKAVAQFPFTIEWKLD